MTSPTTSDSISYSRRTFLKTGSVAVAGLAVAAPAFSAADTQTLALNGGSKSVVFPEKQFEEVTPSA